MQRAQELIKRGDLHSAQSLLQAVVARAPAEYVYQTEEDGKLVIKFWDRGEFLHYVTWQREHGAARPVVWKPSAYPPAYYYLGYIAVAQKDFLTALKWLEAGQRLEPTQPLFLHEMALAYLGLGNLPKSLALYEQVPEVGPHVTGQVKAMALRGKGMRLIDLEQLDAAEEALTQSLKYEPDNKIASKELAYIARLRAGGQKVGVQLSDSEKSEKCVRCGRPVGGAKVGKVANVDGRLIYLCERCAKSETKRWWQFWK